MQNGPFQTSIFLRKTFELFMFSVENKGCCCVPYRRFHKKHLVSLGTNRVINFGIPVSQHAAC